MTETSDKPDAAPAAPASAPDPAAKPQPNERTRRLAAALRDNLRRRKVAASPAGRPGN